MHSPAPLVISAFGSGDPIAALPQTQQLQYLRGYLADLGATSVLEEPNYFDRDYLSEFAAFYSVSATGYSNLCRRLHFFSAPFSRAQFEVAIGGDAAQIQAIQKSTLVSLYCARYPKRDWAEQCSDGMPTKHRQRRA